MIREDTSLDMDNRRRRSRSSEHGLVSGLMKQWKKGSTYRPVEDSEESARLNEQPAEEVEEGYEMDSGDVDQHD